MSVLVEGTDAFKAVAGYHHDIWKPKKPAYQHKADRGATATGLTMKLAGDDEEPAARVPMSLGGARC